MKIAVVASEAAPFARTGGLGDVVGALPKSLVKLGNDVIVFVPGYGGIDINKYNLSRFDWSTSIEMNGQSQPVTVDYLNDKKNGLEYYFPNHPEYFGRTGLYLDPATGKEYDDNDERYLFFNLSVLAILKKIDFKPDIIHVHDWQAGLIPAFVKKVYRTDPLFSETRTVLTIHNLAYQGVFDKSRYPMLGLPDELFFATGPFEFYEKVNFLKGAISFADKITAVSPRYSREIQSSPELGCGLDGLLKQRADDLTGILNGVDYTVWSPSRDKKIPFNYHRANLSGKKENKVELLRKSGLPIREKTPLIGVISRLVDQKGFDLVTGIADELFELNIQMVVLGNGEKKYHDFFEKLEQKYPDKLKVYLKFDDQLAHLIEAGADIFMMPSRFEPCGLNQMYSLKYGTVPVVREVGGLADTVVDYNENTGEGTGFVFKEYTKTALIDAITRAMTLYSNRRLWFKIIKAGMKQDFSWDKAAARYDELFRQLMVK